MEFVNICGKAKCCPKIATDDDDVYIKDDDGNFIKITRDQFVELQKYELD
jgi:hypothetical protein